MRVDLKDNPGTSSTSLRLYVELIVIRHNSYLLCTGVRALIAALGGPPLESQFGGQILSGRDQQCVECRHSARGARLKNEALDARLPSVSSQTPL